MFFDAKISIMFPACPLPPAKVVASRSLSAAAAGLGVKCRERASCREEELAVLVTEGLGVISWERSGGVLVTELAWASESRFGFFGSRQYRSRHVMGCSLGRRGTPCWP